MKPSVTVITCSYNPRPDYLDRTLEGLRSQTFPMTEWEYLLIDNNSSLPISVNLGWHPQARILQELKLGKIHALLRAVAEARGDLLVIVDDDNVLAPDYLEKAVEAAFSMPFLGVWGGQILPEFEVSPPDWANPYLGYLTLRTLQREEWSNIFSSLAPAGAGMCLRSLVARRFVENMDAFPERMQLGRNGSSLLTGEDWEMALAACDLGLGMGHLPQLQLTHLIAARRLELDYLLHLVGTVTFSYQVFVHIRELHSLSHHPPTWLQRMIRRLNLWRLDSIRRKFLQAEWLALDDANRIMSKYKIKGSIQEDKFNPEFSGVKSYEKNTSNY